MAKNQEVIEEEPEDSENDQGSELDDELFNIKDIRKTINVNISSSLLFIFGA